MGHAAYNRGSQVIRREIDAEANPRPRGSQPLNWDLQRAALESRIASLEAENGRARRALNSSRATLAVERETSAGLLAEVERLKAERAAWAKAFLRAERRWRWVSRIVRAYVTPEQVAEFRAESGE